jgi:hypothetical protein
VKRLLPLLVLMLGGCTSQGESSYQEYWKIVKQGFSGSFGGGGISLDQAAAVPYASMGLRINGGQEGIVVLATQSGDNLLWTSSAHVVVETVNGRIKRTVGTPQEVSVALPQSEGAVLSPAQALKGPYNSTRTIDWPKLAVFGTTLNCRTAIRGIQKIKLLGKPMTTTRIDETCASQDGDWVFTDSYWVSRDDGFVWRSLQHLHPKGEVLQTEIFRPPA